MKILFVFIIIIATLVNAHQYDVYDINGKKQGSFNGELNKYILSDFAKKNHGSILVKKNYTTKTSIIRNPGQNQLSSVLANEIEKSIDIRLDTLSKENWIEVEKNENVKICADQKVLAWETSLSSRILNDSCLTFQTPTLIGVDTLRLHFYKDYTPYNINAYSDNNSYKINLAIGMKYIDFKNEEVLLGFNDPDISLILFNRPQEDPEKLKTITATYLVDKYPVTNCEFTLLMWDSIPEKSSYAHLGAKESQEAWFKRKRTISNNAMCAAHDSAAPTIFLYQAMKYANARSIKEGLSPYYIFSETDIRESKILSKGKYIIGYYSFNAYKNPSIQVTIDSTSNGYRLPYYDEWMIFARGGDKKNYAPWGDFSVPIEKVLQYARFGNAKQVYDSDSVGLRRPNGYGLYDMFGNVREHVLFEEINPFEDLLEKPSCFKGGSINVGIEKCEHCYYAPWKAISYGYYEYNGSGFARGGFRLVRKLK